MTWCGADADRLARVQAAPQPLSDVPFQPARAGHDRPFAAVQGLLRQIPGDHCERNALGLEHGLQAPDELYGFDQHWAAHAAFVLEAGLLGAAARHVERGQGDRTERVQHARQAAQVARHHHVHLGGSMQREQIQARQRAHQVLPKVGERPAPAVAVDG